MSIAPVSISSVNKNAGFNFKAYQTVNKPAVQNRKDSFEYTAGNAERQNAVRTALMAAVLAASMVMGQAQPPRAQAAALTAYEAENSGSFAGLEAAMAEKSGEITVNAKNDIPLMSEINQRLLSAEELKELAGLGRFDNAQVIKNLKTMKRSLTEEALAEMCRKAGIKKMPNPDECKVTPSCSDCGRGWGKCDYSKGKSLNKDTGTWQNKRDKRNNTKIYLLRMPGRYSYEQERYTKNGSGVIPGGKQIIDFCNTTKNQIKLGTIYNLQEALKSLGVKK